jgi:hypothetical protein
MSLHLQLEKLQSAAKVKPDGPAAEEVLSIVKSGPPYDDFFFAKLEDVTWLPLLSSNGFFTHLPEVETTGEGKLLYRHHVPLMGLARLAALAPQAVSDILLSLDIPANPLVGDQILRCIIPINDRSKITSLSPLVERLSRTPKRTTGIWLSELLQSWVKGGAHVEALAVFKAYLSATVDSPDETFAGDAWLLREINQNIVEELTSQYPMEVAKAFFETLKSWANAERRRQFGATEPTEGSLENESSKAQELFTYWLEDFKSISETYRELESTLTSRLFETAQAIYEHKDVAKIADLDRLLRSDNWQLFTRLRWQLYADFPDETLELARNDVIERISQMNRAAFIHNYEFAQLLKAHAEKHQFAFLSCDDVQNLFSHVMAGPLDKDDRLIDEEYANAFRRKQLQPLLSLLRDDQLSVFKALTQEEKAVDLQEYKPFRSMGGARVIEHVPPKEAFSLDSLSNAELWAFLNNWQPTKNRFTKADWWVEEDVDALATKFAELLETDTKRFNPEDSWWENLKRPAMLYKPLDRACGRLADKSKSEALTELDWANWFGIAAWITSRQPITRGKQAAPTNDQHEPTDWVWARIVVVKFVKAALNAERLPLRVYQSKIVELLHDLIQEEDPRLDGGLQTKMDDWLTTAINSVRGDAIEALLNLGLGQKKANGTIESWIFALIWARLGMAKESPAIFALLGAKLRLFVHLFGDKLKNIPNRLFPSDKPVHRNAAITAHFTYDHPMTSVVETFPTLLKTALATLEDLSHTKQEDEKDKRREFGAQLGTHIAFYYWNAAFTNDLEGEAVLDQFFAVASKGTRARLISTIGSIFEKETEGSAKIAPRVMRIWERRYEKIVSELERAPEKIADYERELAKFTDWLQCECFPFEWRFKYAMAALGHLKKAPQFFQLQESIIAFSEQSDRLDQALQILLAVLIKPSDELRWSIQAKQLSPVLSKGLASPNPSTRQRAEEARDLLLKLGFFEFLNADKA